MRARCGRSVARRRRAGRARSDAAGDRAASTLLEGVAVEPPGAVAGPTAAMRMLLAEPLEVRARRFRTVFVCGLQEGEFPLSGAAGAVPVRRAPARGGAARPA